MKNLSFKLSVLAVCTSLGLGVSAQDFTSGGIYYGVVSLPDMTCEVVAPPGDEEYTGDIVIPESVEYKGRTFTVTGIGDNAFYDCVGLTGVDIPNTVTSIGNGAFYQCANLTGVTIPSSVIDIGESAFAACTGLTDVSIPSSVMYVGKSAFGNCEGVKNVFIEDCSEALSVYHSSGDNFGLFNKWVPIETLYLGRNISGDFIYYKPFNTTTFTDITIGSMVTDIDCLYWKECEALTTLKSLAANSPSCRGFTNMQYMNVNVYVPKGSLAAYQADEVWGLFWNIHEIETSGISDAEVTGGYAIRGENGNIVMENVTGCVRVYDVAGTLVKSVKADGNRVEIAVPGRGVYVVKTGRKAVKVIM